MINRPAFFMIVLLSVFPFTLLFAQNTAIKGPEKFALVIGNGNYKSLSRLANPINDANDIAYVLQKLGFKTEKILNGNLDQMEKGLFRLKEKLGKSPGSYGFFFYAGHGVQSGGENFLIPVDVNIPSESYLRNRALSVQIILDELDAAGNGLNMIVLDACRDNPFGWSRGGSRGLAIVGRQPVDSIVVYATSAGNQASDGDGRNGLFTSQLLANLATPGIEVKEVFNRTGADVARTSNREQVPAIYNQFFGTAYLGGEPVYFEGQIVNPGKPIIIHGGGVISGTEKFWSVGASVGTSFAAPWVLGTVHGTIAPIKYAFLDIGLDFGLVAGEAGVKYHSFYPFINAAYFMPFGEKGGWHIGLGGGLLIVSYDFPVEGKYSGNFFAAAATAGVNFLDMIDISYTVRTNFKGISHKLAVGYTYRFK